MRLIRPFAQVTLATLALVACKAESRPPVEEINAPNAGGGAVIGQGDAGASDGSTPSNVRVLASGLTGVAGLAVDANTVYVTANGAILAVSRATGASTTLATGLNSPGEILLNAGSLFWVDGAGNIATLTLPGGAPSVFAAEGALAPSSLLGTSTDLFWVELQSPGASPIQLATQPLAGGAKRVVSTHFGNTGHGPALVLPPDAYFTGTDFTSSVVLRAQLTDTGDPGEVVLDVSLGEIVGLATDGATFYMAVRTSSSGAGQIVSAPITGGATKVLADGVQDATFLATDGTTIYFTQTTAGEVDAVSPAGGDAHAIVTGLTSPTRVQVDSAVHVLVAGGVVEIAK